MQIDIAITHGSSGGGLFNMDGQVIGITYAGEDTTGNLNFAIPINDIKSLLDVQTLTTLPQLVLTNKPYAPTDVTANAISSGEIQIQWNPVDGADYYYLYWSYSSDGTYSPYLNYQGSKAQLKYIPSDYSLGIDNLSSNRTVYFKITSVKNGVESDYSDIFSNSTSN